MFDQLLEPRDVGISFIHSFMPSFIDFMYSIYIVLFVSYLFVSVFIKQPWCSHVIQPPPTSVVTASVSRPGKTPSVPQPACQ